MLLTRRTLEAIARSEISLLFRRWRRPVRSGSTRRTAIGVLAIDHVAEVEPSEITDEDASLAGYPSRNALIETLDRGEGTLYRVEVRYVGPDERIARREHDSLTAAELRDEADQLAQLDERSRSGPWTRDYLDAVAAHPERPAAQLAVEIGVDKAQFKRRLRQLKELGLTISCATGYRLSPRGDQVHASLRKTTKGTRRSG